MARVRGNGDGTVSKRCVTECVRDAERRCLQHKGTWQMAIFDGQGKRRYSYFKTEREAKSTLREVLKSRDQGLPVKPERHTMGTLFTAWLDSLVAQVERGERSFNTFREYRSYVEQHLRPALGTIECRKLTVKDVEDYLGALKLAPKTRANHRIALRRALNVAMKWGWVDRNVVKLTDTITLPQREVAAMSFEDANRLLVALQGDPLWSLYVTALYTGLRAGELAGLAIEHIDLVDGTARICQQIQRVPRKGLILKALKTRASNATIDLVPDVVAVLRDVIGSRTSGLVWQTRSDRPYDPAYFTHRFQAALAKAGIPVIPFHYLRHYFVSFLPLLDVHPSVARKLARHASVNTTMNIYTSVEDGLKRQAMSKLHDALRHVAITADVPTDVSSALLLDSSQVRA